MVNSKSILQKSLTVIFSHVFKNLAPCDPRSVEALSKAGIVATEGYTLVQNDNNCLHFSCKGFDGNIREISIRSEQVTFLINKHNTLVQEDLKTNVLQADKSSFSQHLESS